MRETLVAVTEGAVLIIEAMALVVILIGTLGAFYSAIHSLVKPVNAHARRIVWLTYGRWLVAGLTFQLAADILESSVATDWESVGRLAAIAVVRTFLNYFLEKDLNEIRERELSASEAKAALPATEGSQRHA